MITSNRPWLLAILLLAGFQLSKNPDKRPLFFTMENEWRLAVKDQEIFTFQSADTLIYHNARLLSDAKGNPLLFFSDLRTPVCADGECKLANIKIYWNLLGNYVGYGTSRKYPLTKYEHDLFDDSDYVKLHQLLLDNNSVLKRRKITDLVDQVPAKEYKPGFGKADGVSGATKKEIKESVVDGGLYSCYTLWHLVHGEVKEKIKTYLKSIYSDSLNNYFLYSNYEDYQAYALKKLDKSTFGKHLGQIISIFRKSSPLVRTYILKKMPDSVVREQFATEQIFSAFSSLDINTKTQVLKKTGSAHPMAVEILSQHLEAMTKNQLRFYLDLLGENPEYLNLQIKFNLLKTCKSENYAYVYLIKEFLNDKKQ